MTDEQNQPQTLEPIIDRDRVKSMLQDMAVTNDGEYIHLALAHDEAAKLADFARQRWDYSSSQEEADFCLQILEALPY